MWFIYACVCESVCFAQYISKFNWVLKCQVLSTEESKLKRLDQKIFRDIQEISHSPSCPDC